MIANQVGRRYAEAIYEIAVSSDKVKEPSRVEAYFCYHNAE